MKLVHKVVFAATVLPRMQLTRSDLLQCLFEYEGE